MRKHLIYICAAIVMAISGMEVSAATPAGDSAQAHADTITASRAFIEMPLKVLDLLPKTTRKDMLGYYALDSIWVAKNALEGTSQLVTVTPGYLKAKLTDISTMEIKVLPTKKGDIVMSIYTIRGEGGQLAGDSQVSFFDADMSPVSNPAKILRDPRVKDFFSIPKGSMTKMKEIEEIVSFPTIVYTANPENTDVEARLTVGEYMSRDDYNIIKLFLLPSLKLVWNPSKVSFSF